MDGRIKVDDYIKNKVKYKSYPEDNTYLFVITENNITVFDGWLQEYVLFPRIQKICNRFEVTETNQKAEKGIFYETIKCKFYA